MDPIQQSLELPALRKILAVFGTRPEAIKLAPVIKVLEEERDVFRTKICVSGQHREMLDQVLNVFSIRPDYDLDVMKPNQDLFDLTARVLLGLRDVLAQEKPDWILVQGDTTTAVIASLAGFYCGIKVGHVEAGLRSHNKNLPFPEEVNRRITDVLADLYFVPTELSKNNLLKEGFSDGRIIVTGNTVIDALVWLRQRIAHQAVEINALPNLDWSKQIILVTGHRRESFGQDFKSICHALLAIAKLYPDVNIIYPVHLNPNVQAPVKKLLINVPNLHLITPLDYEKFVWLMSKAYIILTDSGGIQEEAPALNKPVLIMRRVTERPEGIAAGTAKLIGVEMEAIVDNVRFLLEDSREYMRMAKAKNPYGDGTAAIKIVEVLRNYSSHT